MKTAERIGVPYPRASSGVIVLKSVGYDGAIEICRHDKATFNKIFQLCADTVADKREFTADTLPAFAEEIKRRLE
jgi:hypothetical protein